MPIPDDILAYHASLPTSQRRVCKALGASIEAFFSATGAPAGVESKIWHRHPVWFIDGNPIVGYHVLKGSTGKKPGGTDGPCIRLMFWSGQSFDEPGLPADPPGTKFKSAAARFSSVDDIVASDLARWLKKSVAIQWDYKNLVKRKGRLVRLK